jgi:hypothetical protein
MSVDAEYEVVVDAALAFGGLDQHARTPTAIPNAFGFLTINFSKCRLVSGEAANKS